MNIKLNYWYKSDHILTNILIDYLSKSNNFFHDLHYDVITNRFLKLELHIILENIRKSLFNRYIIRKYILIFKFKLKKLEIANPQDLLLQDFSKNTKYPYVIENNKIYQFSNTDINCLLKNSLLYSRYRIVTILPMKNPYTNKILNKTELYNLFIDTFLYSKTHWLLKEYVRLNFDNTLFKKLHSSYLLHNAIKTDIKNLSEKMFRQESEKCFVNHIVNKLRKYNSLVFYGFKNIKIEILKSTFTFPLIYDTTQEYEYIYDQKIITNIVQDLLKLWKKFPEVYSCSNLMNNKDIATANFELARNRLINTTHNNTPDNSPPYNPRIFQNPQIGVNWNVFPDDDGEIEMDIIDSDDDLDIMND